MKTTQWLLAVALAAGGCSGIIDNPTNQPPGGNGNGNGPGLGGAGGGVMPPTNTPDSCVGVTGEVPGRRLLRRLTGSEFEATVRGAFALTGPGAWVGLLPPDPAATNGFSNNVERLTIGTEYASAAQDTAKKVADLVAQDAKLGQLLPCATKGDEACANTFLDNYASKLYRRPLTAEERAGYIGLYTKVRQQNDFKTWVYWATTAMLQSPNVHYRSELGDVASGGRYQLTPYEVASALSFTFTGGPPSPELMQLAAANKLATADQLEAAARTLIFNPDNSIKPEFREIVLRFSEQWLGLTSLENKIKDKTAFPDFVPAVQTSMAEETRRFISSIILDDRGKPGDLWTAPYTFVDSTLAGYYKFGGGTNVNGFLRVNRPPGWGMGLLAQGSLLVVKAGSLSTSPTKRGHLVRTQLLCYPVPPPPDVVPNLPEPTAADTTRQRYEKLHASEPTCHACHQMMDPIGFGLEHLDASGRFRDKDNNFPIDDSGTILATTAGDLTFTGADGLAKTVARLPEASDCLASFIASYSLGVDDHASTCMVRNAATELRDGKITILDYYSRMVRSEHFRTRTP
ncbi:MAG TPA: DUF1592 domain-containing protein [Polyangia bacterium]|jgi:hypothetical protein|nr:DUF1592 domain-containing protein [Polyangia bacterium]